MDVYKEIIIAEKKDVRRIKTMCDFCGEEIKSAIRYGEPELIYDIKIQCQEMRTCLECFDSEEQVNLLKIDFCYKCFFEIVKPTLERTIE